jgi:hypothetical protein
MNAHAQLGIRDRFCIARAIHVVVLACPGIMVYVMFTVKLAPAFWAHPARSHLHLTSTSSYFILLHHNRLFPIINST